MVFRFMVGCMDAPTTTRRGATGNEEAAGQGGLLRFGGWRKLAAERVPGGAGRDVGLEEEAALHGAADPGNRSVAVTAPFVARKIASA